MRDYASAQQEYNDLLRRFNELQRGFDILQNSVDNGAGVGAIAANVLDLQRRTEVNLSFVQALQDLVIPDINDASQNQVEALYNDTGELRERYNLLLDSLSELTRGAAENDRNRNFPETQPKNSAGDIVDNEQDAQKADAKVQSPQQGRLTTDEDGNVVPQPENVNTGTNAREPNTADDAASNPTVGTQASGGATSNVGGDAPVVSAEQTQRPNNGEPATVAPNEDQTSPQQTSTATSTGQDGKPAVAKEFLEPIISKPNLLSGLSSMTYGLSLYLMSPDEYGEFVAAEKKILPSNQLLIQSAGAAKEERNEWFNVDFYIEEFNLESVVGTQELGSPHNAITLEFTVVEPQGITLLNRLNNAVIAHIGQQDKKINAMAMTYLMVIRFYGYDAAGNAVTAANLGLEATTDSDAIIEKFIPFVITNFTYKIDTKSTEYAIKGACHGTNIAFSTQRGEIPFNIQLTAATVDQLFNGNKILSETQVQATEEAGEQSNITNQAGNTQTIVSGLVQALNEQQQRLAGESYDIPDEYEIIFQDPDIKNAKLLKPGNVNKGNASNQTSVQSAQKFLNSKLNYDKESRTWNVPAGMTIAQLLDLVLRTSSYITSQQDVYIDEKTGKIVGSDDPNGQARSVPTVQWYRIKSQVAPKGYDKTRKTIAYKISYIVSKYQINTPRSPYFPPAEYRGVHKLYNYWFTGLNTEVLDFTIDVNTNYYTVIGNDGRVDERAQGNLQVPHSYSSAPGQTQQGGNKGSSIPAANLSDRLYSPADVAVSTIEIVGDPDWIQQSEVVYNKSVSFSPFLQDGSVNYDSSEVLFELRFNPVQDYDLETGLSIVDENNRDIVLQGKNENYTEANVAQESLVWTALTVTSMFREGSFTQRLTGAYRDFSSSKNAPVNPQAQVVLSDGNTVEQSLAKQEEDNEPQGAIVGGVRTNAGGIANREKAQTQRNNLNSGTPKTGVTTVTSQASENAGGTRNRDRAQAQRLAVQASANQSVDDDAGTETTRVIGGRSARARR